ncbi:hypothetical protein PRIPAC_91903 [Pristionchus pacificus]|uniref:Uncharacterized protein n=1 Tax=Pristionchus pacificus TaxID=54126 RepID=A0A8R1V2U3_PRIPA|nr:hypothetical protein PRIPAC_91903 [Pristionchus pacificus]
MGQHPSNLLNHTRSLLERRKFSTLTEDAISLLGNEEGHAEPKQEKNKNRNHEKARKFLRIVWRRRKSRRKKKNAIDAESLRGMREELMYRLEVLIDTDREEEEEFAALLFQLMAVGKNSFTLKEISLFVVYAQRRLRETEERMEKEKEGIDNPLGDSVLEECNQLFYVLTRMEKGSDADNCYFPSNDIFVDYIFASRLSLSVKVHLVRNYLLIRMAILQLRAVVTRGSRKREVDEYKEHVKDCLEAYSLNALDLPSFHPLRSLPLFLLLEGAKEKSIETFLVKRAKELKFTRVSLRGVSQLEGKDAVIRDALEDAWFNYKYPFIKKTRDQRSKDKIK